MRFADRVCGIEHEFGVTLQDSSGNFLQPVPESFINPSFFHREQPYPGTLMPGVQRPRAWHINGGCTYMDRGDHPEHCTPECRTAREAALYARAGEELCAEFFEGVRPEGWRIRLFKNNLGCDEHAHIIATFGCHENYMMHDRYTFDQEGLEHTRMVIPFLITRQILDGAGWWTADNTYIFSQRSLYNKQARANYAGFFSIKPETSTGATARFHVTSGDSNMCEFAAYLKVGATMLVLALAEADTHLGLECTNIPTCLDDLTCGIDATVVTPTITFQGTSLSPLEVQTIYFEAARSAIENGTFESEETEADYRRVLVLWEQTLNAFYRGDEEWMRGRLDWATKKYLIEKMIGTDIHLVDPAANLKEQIKNMDILYHDVSDAQVQTYIRRRWPDRQLFTEAEVARAKITPPQNTRARLRAKFIEAVLRAETDAYPHTIVDWARFSLGRRGVAPMTPFDYPDPLVFESRWLDAFLQKMEDARSLLPSQ